MIKLNTTIYGIPISSPVVVGSSGLSSKPETILEMKKAGAGALILKSIFEEEILIEHELLMKNRGRFDEDYEFLDYFDYQIKQDRLKEYIDQIRMSKSLAGIPVIASINCISMGEWTPFAKEIEKAGADGIELNILPLPVDIAKSSLEYEKEYTKIIQTVKNAVRIPVGVKIGQHFTGLGASIKSIAELSDGVTLFNRPFKPDIDIYTKALKPGEILSAENSYLDTLRWIFLMSEKSNYKLHASTGVRSGEILVKMLMAGAKACQVVTGIYKNGPAFIHELNTFLKRWMEENKITELKEIKNILKNDSKNGEYFMRSQFLKHFGNFDN